MKHEEFLEKLDKSQLILLLEDLSQRFPEVNTFLSEKADEKVEISKNEQNILLPVKMISRLSSPEEKIALFKSLFIGREDVFALRWFNSKTQKSGYSPVCANKWKTGKCDLKKYSCSTCPYKLPVRLDEKYIFNHLAGRDEYYQDVIGLYPLLEENTCRFLAFDFDGHDVNENFWKEDAAVLFLFLLHAEKEKHADAVFFRILL